MAKQNEDYGMAIETDASSALMGKDRHKHVEITPELARKHREFLSWRFGLFMHFNIATWFDKGWANGHEDPLTFAPDQLDCNQWAEAALSAGMNYAVLTVKHTEGYPLWRSATTSHDITAFKNFRGGDGDLVEEYVTACRRVGLKVGLYYCLPGDYSVDRPCATPLKDGQIDLHGMPPEAGGEPQAMIEMINAHIRELFQNYGAIDMIWFDQTSNKYTGKEWLNQKALVHSLQPDCIVLANNSTNFETTDIHSYEYPWLMKREGHVPGDELPPVDNPWPAEVCDTVVGDWFWQSSNQLAFGLERTVEMLKTCNARKANYLLNIPPDRSGLIRSPYVEMMQEIGQLLKRNPANEADI
jgi:alpha-L-fucosidase